MLTERKRFNYMANAGHYGSAQKKNYTSAIKPVTTVFQEDLGQHVHQVSSREDKENARRMEEGFRRVEESNRKVEELEHINKKLVEETARQFKKLEEDVQRVEKILQEKEEALDESKEEKQNLREEVNKVCEEKKILIEAIFEKDLVIKEYENKLKEMLEENMYKVPTTIQQSVSVETESAEMQTEPLPESCPKSQLSQLQKQNFQLQDQAYRLKEQLFDASNKVKLLTQQFQAYKILKEIENIQQS